MLVCRQVHTLCPQAQAQPASTPSAIPTTKQTRPIFRQPPILLLTYLGTAIKFWPFYTSTDPPCFPSARLASIRLNLFLIPHWTRHSSATPQHTCAREQRTPPRLTKAPARTRIPATPNRDTSVLPLRSRRQASLYSSHTDHTYLDRPFPSPLMRSIFPAADFTGPSSSPSPSSSFSLAGATSSTATGRHGIPESPPPTPGPAVASLRENTERSHVIPGGRRLRAYR